MAAVKPLSMKGRYLGSTSGKGTTCLAATVWNKTTSDFWKMEYLKKKCITHNKKTRDGLENNATFKKVCKSIRFDSHAYSHMNLRDSKHAPNA